MNEPVISCTSESGTGLSLWFRLRAEQQHPAFFNEYKTVQIQKCAVSCNTRNSTQGQSDLTCKRTLLQFPWRSNLSGAESGTCSTSNHQSGLEMHLMNRCESFSNTGASCPDTVSSLTHFLSDYEL